MVRLTPAQLDLAAAAAGFGLVVYGVGLWSRPAAAIVAGLLILVSVFWRKKGMSGDEHSL